MSVCKHGNQQSVGAVRAPRCDDCDHEQHWRLQWAGQFHAEMITLYEGTMPAYQISQRARIHADAMAEVMFPDRLAQNGR